MRCSYLIPVLSHHGPPFEEMVVIVKIYECLEIASIVFSVKMLSSVLGTVMLAILLKM